MFGTYCRLNVNLSASNIEVLRQARKKLRKGAFLCDPNGEKQFYRVMLGYHASERKTYINARF